MNTYWDLFIGFFRASNFSFGGGPASIPLVQAEVVTKYKWLTNEEFADVLAIANSLPAPIATKLAGMIGFRVKGWLGSFIAIMGAILPTTLIVVLLGGLIMNYAESPALKAMLKGVRPVVAVLLAQTAIQMGQKALSGKTTWIFCIIALIIMLFVPFIHPAFLVVISMLLGYFIFKK
ncbi:MAG: chromate transporter [Peptococcaceae bacterium]|nr:chromate transporter [Peptococcaceae bacterium]